MFRKMVLIVLVIAFGLMASASLTGCSPEKKKLDLELSIRGDGAYLGDGIFLFSTDHWPSNFIAFRHNHPRLRIENIVEGDWSGGYSMPTTMLVITELADTTFNEIQK